VSRSGLATAEWRGSCGGEVAGEVPVVIWRGCVVHLGREGVVKLEISIDLALVSWGGERGAHQSKRGRQCWLN
jgi:hypothetical protein